MGARIPPGQPVPWFRCDAGAVLYRLGGLSAQEGLTYVTLLMLVHEAAGPVAETAQTLGGRLGLRPGAITNALAVLKRAEWVVQTNDGRLDMPETHAEITWRHSVGARRLNGPSDERRRIPPNWAAIRAEIFARDGFVCAYCETAEGPFEIDHVEAYVRGGSHAPSNLCVACVPCNRGKNDRSAAEWRAILAARALPLSSPSPGGP
ncbi:HNH endonuclease [Methylobacterium sp. D53M]